MPASAGLCKPHESSDGSGGAIRQTGNYTKLVFKLHFSPCDDFNAIFSQFPKVTALSKIRTEKPSKKLGPCGPQVVADPSHMFILTC